MSNRFSEAGLDRPIPALHATLKQLELMRLDAEREAAVVESLRERSVEADLARARAEALGLAAGVVRYHFLGDV